MQVTPSTAGAAYIRTFIFYQHIKYLILNMFKIKSENVTSTSKIWKKLPSIFVKSE